MKFNSVAGRLMAGSAISALAIGGLVATAPSAGAVAVTTKYTCTSTTPGVAPFEATLETNAELPATIGAGTDVPAALIAVTNKATISESTYGLFAFVGATSVTVKDYNVTVDETAVEVTGQMAATTAFTQNADGTRSAAMQGTNAAFEVPAAGTYDVAPPATFTVSAVKADGSSIDVPCAAAAAPTAISSVEVQKNASTLTVKPKKSAFPVGDLTLKVRATADNQTPTGKVEVLLKGTKIGKGKLDAKGKVTVVIKGKKLTVGKHKLVVKYLGDDYTVKGKLAKKIEVVV